jgi:hypothetical protein
MPEKIIARRGFHGQIIEWAFVGPFGPRPSQAFPRSPDQVTASPSSLLAMDEDAELRHSTATVPRRRSTAQDPRGSTAKVPRRSTAQDPRGFTATDPCRSTVPDPRSSTAMDPCRSTAPDPCRSTARDLRRSTATDPRRSTASDPRHSTAPAPDPRRSFLHRLQNDDEAGETISPPPLSNFVMFFLVRMVHIATNCQAMAVHQYWYWNAMIDIISAMI